MEKQRAYTTNIVRSDGRIRESVRSLPKGHFQQIRQMFDKQTTSTRKLATIHERQQKPFPAHTLLNLPVTDDEKLKHTNRINEEISAKEYCRDYLAEYQAFRLKLTNELNEHKSMYPTRSNEQLSQQTTMPVDQTLHNQTILSYTTSLPTQFSSSERESSSSSPVTKPCQSTMSGAINYTDSYDTSLSSTHFNRAGSSRHYVSSLQHTLATHTKPVLVTTPTTCNPLKRNPPTMTNESYNSLRPSRRLHSSTSLSSTGYDTNSSPSIKSKRNSIATNNSNDFLIHSTCSLSSSSSDEQQQQQQQQLLQPWKEVESYIPAPSVSTSIHNDDVFECSNDPTPLISRTQIKLNPPTLEHCPITVIRHATVRNAVLIDSPSASSLSSTTSIHEPIIGHTKTPLASYMVQTTSFPDSIDGKVDRKIRRWNNVHTDRTENIVAADRTRKYPLLSTNSTGFQVIMANNQEDEPQLTTFRPMTEQKASNEREESPLPLAENPVYSQLPPKKPPRTFKQENTYDQSTKINDQKVPSPSSSSYSTSPTFDLGARSVSCMDLTAGVSNALLSSGLLPLEHERAQNSHRESTLAAKTRKPSVPNANIYEELKTPTVTSRKDTTDQFLFNSSQPQINEIQTTDVPIRTPTIKTKADHPSRALTKSAMKKGVSEPNLAKNSRSKSPFSPRGLLDRFKRILPLTLSSSKQSLNEKSTNANDSDDSTSTSSDNNDHLRTSRLDHVSRVRNAYDSLSISNHMSSLFTDPNRLPLIDELTTLYDYVVQIIPEKEVGYFSNGNGCLSSSHLHQEPRPTSTHFKYPFDAQEEEKLKYFCFPDQHDANNNPIVLNKKTSPEYFRFTLTNMHGMRQYGYCSRFFHKGILNALCLISPSDMLEVYEKILATATELFLSYKDAEARRFLQEIYHHRLPTRGDTIYIDTSTVGLYTLKCEYDRRKELIDSVILLSLSTDTIIKIFSSILYEQKLIFIGNDIGPLTRLIHTLVCLLYPFSWPHTYVPVLPAMMLDVIQAPTPYIIGILRSCESYLSCNDDLRFQDSSDILIVDIDHDRIRSISDYQTGQSVETSPIHPLTHSDNARFQILPKIFKIELKQEISLLRKNKYSFSLDDCQQRLRDVFMSIFVQSCYNYKEYFDEAFQRDQFVQSKQHTIELFLEWFTRTQIFELFIRQKFEFSQAPPFAVTFDIACENYSRTLNKQTPQRITVKSVKRKSATRANKQDHRF